MGTGCDHFVDLVGAQPLNPTTVLPTISYPYSKIGAHVTFHA